MSQVVKITSGTPHAATQADEEECLPADAANHPFVFVHYPLGWGFDNDLGFLPELSEIIGKPGVNGVGKDGKLNRAIGGAIAKGGRIIQPNDARLGEHKGYVHAYKCKGGGRRFAFAGAEFAVMPGGKVIERDGSARLREFRRHVRDAGLIDALEPVVYDRMMDTEQRGLERLVRDAVKLPHLADKVDAKKARIAAMRKAWSQLLVKTDAEPKKRTVKAKSEPVDPTAGIGEGAK